MKKPSARLLLILVLIADICLCATFILTNSGINSKIDERQISEPNIQKLCELATLECYYHNVSDWSQSAYGLFGYGAKKIWIEYDGVIRVGIKAGSIKISNPDENDVITVIIPAATILEKDLDENSIKEISSDTPVLLIFNDSVKTEDRKNALANAQEDMEASAANNEMILGEAWNRAKKIIERNIVALGEARGKHYTVEFIDASLENE